MTNQRAFGLAPLPPLARGATANGHRSHPLSGHPVSVTARCGKVTLPVYLVPGELPFRTAQSRKLGVQKVDGFGGHLPWHRGLRVAGAPNRTPSGSSFILLATKEARVMSFIQDLRLGGRRLRQSGATHQRLMSFDGGNQQITVAGLLIIDLAVDDDLILGFLDLYHFAELGRGRSPNPGHGRKLPGPRSCRLMRQLLVEGLLLSLTGGVMGVAV